MHPYGGRRTVSSALSHRFHVIAVIVALLLAGSFGQTTSAAPGDVTCSGDVDGDGMIGFPDLLAVLAAWGPCPGCPEDVDGNGAVAFEDLLAVLSSWGPCS